MKNIATLLAIATLASACQTPAYAGEPTPDLPAPPMPAAAQPTPQTVTITAQEWKMIQQYLTFSAIKWADVCLNENPAWFCSADNLLKQIKPKPAPTCEAKPE